MGERSRMSINDDFIIIDKRLMGGYSFALMAKVAHNYLLAKGWTLHPCMYTSAYTFEMDTIPRPLFDALVFQLERDSKNEK